MEVANKLKLSNEETEVIICGSKASQLKVSVGSFHIGQSLSPLSDTVRDLGVFLDKNLLMTTYIGAGGLFLACHNFEKMFDHSFPACATF